MHPAAVGVTVMVPLMAVDPVLVAVKEETFPLPLAPSPIEVLELVQVKDPPAGVIEIPLAGTVAPLQ